LDRVLAYPDDPDVLVFGLDPQDVLAARDAWLLRQPKAPVTCKDPDDQRFIDLAIAHRCLVLGKDHAVLSMAKRLLALGALRGQLFNFITFDIGRSGGSWP